MRQPYSPIADAIAICIGSVIGFVFVVLSIAFAPFVWLYGRLGGGK